MGDGDEEMEVEEGEQEHEVRTSKRRKVSNKGIIVMFTGIDPDMVAIYREVNIQLYSY